jgi:hypothetical protein
MGRDEWVVCRGATRETVAGLLSCPRQGRVPLHACLDCRLLVTWSGERRSGWCRLADLVDGPMTMDRAKEERAPASG